MAASPPRLTGEAHVWALSATLALGGASLGALCLVQTSAPAAERLFSPAVIAVSGSLPQPPAGARVDEARAFRLRLRMFAPLQAALIRAFAPPAALRLQARALDGARVRAASTPQGCLAQAVYYESRGEPAAGQAAVAQVVLNRVRSGRHPASVCGVVFEGARHAACQFSFACDLRLGRARPEPAAWARAEQIATGALAGNGTESLRDALNFHADYVRPGWAGRLQRAAAIGRHIFYAAAPRPAPHSAPVPGYVAGE